MDIRQIKHAVEEGGSVRQASRLLGVSHSTLLWHIARAGYEVTATLRKRQAKRKVGKSNA